MNSPRSSIALGHQRVVLVLCVSEDILQEGRSRRRGSNRPCTREGGKRNETGQHQDKEQNFASALLDELTERVAVSVRLPLWERLRSSVGGEERSGFRGGG